jgi:hypothetical protein
VQCQIDKESGRGQNQKFQRRIPSLKGWAVVESTMAPLPRLPQTSPPDKRPQVNCSKHQIARVTRELEWSRGYTEAKAAGTSEDGIALGQHLIGCSVLTREWEPVPSMTHVPRVNYSFSLLISVFPIRLSQLLVISCLPALFPSRSRPSNQDPYLQLRYGVLRRLLHIHPSVI